MKVIVGLGNPGAKYELSRHNAGFWVLDNYADKHRVSIDKAKFNALIGEFNHSGEKIILVKPMTYMNESGVSVSEILNFYKLDLSDLIVVVDDIEIELGTLRIRKKGGKGTHNGLKSIYNHLKSNDYTKVKLGVGKFMRDCDLADFVLARPPKKDSEIIDMLVNKAVDSLDAILDIGIDNAMNNYNGKIEIDG